MTPQQTPDEIREAVESLIGQVIRLQDSTGKLFEAKLIGINDQGLVFEEGSFREVQ